MAVLLLKGIYFIPYIAGLILHGRFCVFSFAAIESHWEHGRQVDLGLNRLIDSGPEKCKKLMAAESHQSFGSWSCEGLGPVPVQSSLDMGQAAAAALGTWCMAWHSPPTNVLFHLIGMKSAGLYGLQQSSAKLPLKQQMITFTELSLRM